MGSDQLNHIEARILGNSKTEVDLMREALRTFGLRKIVRHVRAEPRSPNTIVELKGFGFGKSQILLKLRSMGWNVAVYFKGDATGVPTEIGVCRRAPKLLLPEFERKVARRRKAGA